MSNPAFVRLTSNPFGNLPQPYQRSSTRNAPAGDLEQVGQGNRVKHSGGE